MIKIQKRSTFFLLKRNWNRFACNRWIFDWLVFKDKRGQRRVFRFFVNSFELRSLWNLIAFDKQWCWFWLRSYQLSIISLKRWNLSLKWKGSKKMKIDPRRMKWRRLKKNWKVKTMSKNDIRRIIRYLFWRWFYYGWMGKHS